MKTDAMSDWTIAKLIKQAEGGLDPLGVTTGTVTDVQLHLLDLLRGVDDAVADAISACLPTIMKDRRTGEPRAGTDIDTVFARLVAHMGIDPLVVCWIARCNGAGTFSLGDAAIQLDTWSDLGDHHGSRVAFTEGATWHDDGSVVVARLPATVMASCVGRPLADIVSHPVLDELGLVVKRAVEDKGPGARTRLRTDHVPAFTTMDALASLSRHVAARRAHGIGADLKAAHPTS